MNLYIKAIGFEQVDSDFEEQMIHAGILDSLEKGLVIKNNELNRGAVIVRISESTGLYIYGAAAAAPATQRARTASKLSSTIAP